MAAVLATAFAAVLPASAQRTVSFGELRAMIDGGMRSVHEDIFIEGIIISDVGNENLDQNSARFYTAIDLRNNRRRAYIESLDGQYGFRIGLATTDGANMLPRYAKVRLNLYGATLEFLGPKRYSIYSLSESGIVSVEKGTAADLPVKERRITELCDDDIYTFVTLKDCEFVFKDGSYSNIYETYALATPLNNGTGANNSMDGWATLLCDSHASTVYMLVNSRCQWRRNGNGVPKGAGTVGGIVVYTHMPRYGGNVLGRYEIRPLDQYDIRMSWDEAASNFRTIAEWNWNDGRAEFATEKGSAKSVRGERIKADIGTGFLSSKAGGTAVRSRDMNNPSIETSTSGRGVKGTVNYGAMGVRTEACNWWNWEEERGNGIEVEFSTEGLSGSNLVFAFTFSAGDINANSSYDYPVYWRVDWSTDGRNFTRVDCPDFVLRSLPWWWRNNVDGKNYETSTEAGMGFTEHLVSLPRELFGQKNVTLRLSPARKNVATLAFEQSDKGALRPNLKTRTYVNFGAFAVRYN